MAVVKSESTKIEENFNIPRHVRYSLMGLIEEWNLSSGAIDVSDASALSELEGSQFFIPGRSRIVDVKISRTLAGSGSKFYIPLKLQRREWGSTGSFADVTGGAVAANSAASDVSLADNVKDGFLGRYEEKSYEYRLLISADVAAGDNDGGGRIALRILYANT